MGKNSSNFVSQAIKEGRHVIALLDSTTREYYLATCCNRLHDGNCSRYCNVDCAHWSHAEDITEEDEKILKNYH